MNDLERELVQSPSLPTIPRVAQKLLELLQQGEVELTQVAELVSADPALSAKVIRLINSPLYGLSRQITSVRDAVLYLGLNSVRSAALSFSFLSAFPPGSQAGERLDGLWRTSLMNALAARRLAGEVGGWDPEEAFLAGLVADAGALLMVQRVSEYGALLDRFWRGEGDLIELEEDQLKTNHARLGKLLLEKWNFPANLVELVGLHHDSAHCRSDSPTALQARVLISAWLCARSLTVPGFTGEITNLEHTVSDILGIPLVVARGLAAELPAELRETAALFDVPAGEQRSYNELLDEANQALSLIAIEADQSARKLAEALAVGRRAFGRLQSSEPAEEDLDPETKLLGAAPFERLLDAFHRRALEIHRPLGLLIVEVENLKGVEVRGGASATIEALIRIAERIEACTRQGDHRARLAEDQIAILLPGCGSRDLLTAAERVRFELEGEPLATSTGPVPCQVAIGLAVTTPHTDAIDPATLIRFAQSALERARLIPERVALH